MFTDSTILIREPRRPAVPEDDVVRMWLACAGPDTTLATIDGRSLRVIDPGARNRHDGPDFLSAAVVLDGTLRRGDIEVHVRPEDWRRHGHGGDARYARVMLHVCLYGGVFPPGIPGVVLSGQLGVPFRDAWADARAGRQPLPCRRGRAAVPEGARDRDGTAATAEALVALLAARRYARKLRAMERRLGALSSGIGEGPAVRQLVCEGVARAAGYGGNQDSFEMLARGLPLRELAMMDAGQRVERLAAAAGALRWNAAAVMPHNRIGRRLRWFAAWAVRLEDPSWWRATIELLRRGERDTEAWLPLFIAAGVPEQPGRGRVAEFLVNVLAPAMRVYAARKGDTELARTAAALYFHLEPAQANRHTRLIAPAFDLACDRSGQQQGMIELSAEFCHAQRCAQCPMHGRA